MGNLGYDNSKYNLQKRTADSMRKSLAFIQTCIEHHDINNFKLIFF